MRAQAELPGIHNRSPSGVNLKCKAGEFRERPGRVTLSQA